MKTLFLTDLTDKLTAKRVLKEAALVKSSFFNWGWTKNENSKLRILLEEVFRHIAMAYFQVCDNGSMDRIVTPDFYKTIKDIWEYT